MSMKSRYMRLCTSPCTCAVRARFPGAIGAVKSTVHFNQVCDSSALVLIAYAYPPSSLCTFDHSFMQPSQCWKGSQNSSKLTVRYECNMCVCCPNAYAMGVWYMKPKKVADVSKSYCNLPNVGSYCKVVPTLTSFQINLMNSTNVFWTTWCSAHFEAVVQERINPWRKQLSACCLLETHHLSRKCAEWRTGYFSDICLSAFVPSANVRLFRCHEFEPCLVLLLVSSSGKGRLVRVPVST